MSAIFFDMDGTLVDSEPLWLEAEIEVMLKEGCIWTAEDQLACLGGPRAKTERIMREKSGRQVPDGYFGEQLDKLMELKLSNHLNLVPGSLELLNDCKSHNLKIGLVTASGNRLMNVVLKSFPADTFDVVISGDDVVNSKPHPEPYLTAAGRVSVDITKTVVIEDSVTGATSGLASGAQVLGIPHLVNLPKHENLRVVSKLSDITVAKLMNWYPFLKGDSIARS
jgi:HAD superfamily hydrolase (TIGR01509 family)